MNARYILVRVAAKRTEAEDIFSLELVAADGQPLPAFAAGAHLDVVLPNGLTRQYSLCNSPAERNRYVIAVLRTRASRGGSQAVHDIVQQGDVLRISAPRNQFALVPGAAHSILMAGGIGVTPLLCMAEQLAAEGAPFELHYCTRSRARTAFYDRLACAVYARRVQFHFDDGAPGQRVDLDAVLSGTRDGAHLYVCGPKAFMDAVLAAAEKHGWPPEAVHYEFFSAEPLLAGDGAFEVKLAKSGLLVHVAEDQTVVEALRQAGIDIPTSCEQGVCGTCLTRVLDGVPDHRDMYLRPEEHARNDQFTPCCSRSKTGVLVLDL